MTMRPGTTALLFGFLYAGCATCPEGQTCMEPPELSPSPTPSLSNPIVDIFSGETSFGFPVEDGPWRLEDGGWGYVAAGPALKMGRVAYYPEFFRSARFLTRSDSNVAIDVPDDSSAASFSCAAGECQVGYALAGKGPEPDAVVNVADVCKLDDACVPLSAYHETGWYVVKPTVAGTAKDDFFISISVVDGGWKHEYFTASNDKPLPPRPGDDDDGAGPDVAVSWSISWYGDTGPEARASKGTDYMFRPLD